MSLPAVFARYRAEIDAGLKAVVDGRRSPLYDMLRYHMGWIDDKGNTQAKSNGKALRPTLCLLACEAVGADYRRALPAAVAVELVHNFSLIHDDIQDDDKERRHRPTVWSIWGKPQAINAGTAMRILANLALSSLADLGVSFEKQRRAQYLVDEDCLRLIEGQYLDISFESRFDITVGDYLDMVDRKTSALLACSLELGALVGTDDEKVIGGFREAGRNLGLAFQIRDDILGIWGDEEKTGKPSCSDIRRKKKSLPIVYALENARGELRNKLVTYYSNGASGSSGVAIVLKVLESVEAQAQAQKIAERYRDAAINTIQQLPISPLARRDLDELFDFLVVRSY